MCLGHTADTISLEPEEATLPMDKTISKDNTHRVGEGKVHNSIYDMNKLAASEREKAGNETISIQHSQMFK